MARTHAGWKPHYNTPAYFGKANPRGLIKKVGAHHVSVGKWGGKWQLRSSKFQKPRLFSRLKSAMKAGNRLVNR